MDLFVPDKYSLPTEDLFSSTDLFEVADHDNGDFSIDSPKDVLTQYSQYLTNTILTVERFCSNVKIQDQSESGEMGVDVELNLVYKTSDRYFVFPKQDITEIKIKDLDLNYFNLYLGDFSITFEFQDLEEAKTIQSYFTDDEITLKELSITPTLNLSPKLEVIHSSDIGNKPEENKDGQALEIELGELSLELQQQLQNPLSEDHIAEINSAYREKQKVIKLANEKYLEILRSLLAKPCSLCYDQITSKRIIPCNHELCSTCSEKIDSVCPWCRTEIKEIK
ncbi:hypothetical protein HDV06_005214 [Boothiomyces sp. JEL0866]|nr:hypothetical protein HDV06_005214 [Boothiomyces sp. JEL0866]